MVQLVGVHTPNPTLPTITATVASSAMTINASTQMMSFRNATLGIGSPVMIGAAPSALIIPSTATLGTVSATLSRLIVLEMNIGSAVELAVVNIAGGNNLDETTLISTTAIAGGSNTANVIYSTTSRSSVPFRVIGYIESTQATAGTWATVPSTIQSATWETVVGMVLHSAGAAPMFACRAWCTFSGTATGTNAPTAGGNVTSVTRNGAGNYTVNFTIPMIDANYAVVITNSNGGAVMITAALGLTGPNGNSNNFSSANITVNGFEFQLAAPSSSVGTDTNIVHVVVYR